MFSQYDDAVQKIYIGYFGRPADPLGLQYWDKVVEAANGDTSAVGAAFAASAEFKADYGSDTSAQIIDHIYHDLFGRAAEAAGLSYWSQGLANGAFTVDQAAAAIAGGAQGNDLAYLDNKVAAAEILSVQLSTPSGIAGYSGAAANQIAAAWLAGVTDDASLAQATTPEALNQIVGELSPPRVTGVAELVGVPTATHDGGHGA